MNEKNNVDVQNALRYMRDKNHLKDKQSQLDLKEWYKQILDTFPAETNGNFDVKSIDLKFYVILFAVRECIDQLTIRSPDLGEFLTFTMRDFIRHVNDLMANFKIHVENQGAAKKREISNIEKKFEDLIANMKADFAEERKEIVKKDEQNIQQTVKMKQIIKELNNSKKLSNTLKFEVSYAAEMKKLYEKRLTRIEEIINNRHKEMLASTDDSFQTPQQEAMNTANVNKFTDMVEEIRGIKTMYKKLEEIADSEYQKLFDDPEKEIDIKNVKFGGGKKIIDIPTVQTVTQPDDDLDQYASTRKNRAYDLLEKDENAEGNNMPTSFFDQIDDFCKNYGGQDKACQTEFAKMSVGTGCDKEEMDPQHKRVGVSMNDKVKNNMVKFQMTQTEGNFKPTNEPMINIIQENISDENSPKDGIEEDQTPNQDRLEVYNEEMSRSNASIEDFDLGNSPEKRPQKKLRTVNFMDPTSMLDQADGEARGSQRKSKKQQSCVTFTDGKKKGAFGQMAEGVKPRNVSYLLLIIRV